MSKNRHDMLTAQVPNELSYLQSVASISVVRVRLSVCLSVL